MNKKNMKTIVFYISILLLITGLYYIFVIKNDNPDNKKNISIETSLNETNEDSKDLKSVEKETNIENPDSSKVIKNNNYCTKDDVALYLHLYGELPPNYLTKSKAKKLGWDSSKGNLWDVTDKGVIGGDRFSNREGNLPDDKYFEADVNYNGGYRGAERLVYTKDGKVIYYTGDHYDSFEILYE